MSRQNGQLVMESHGEAKQGRFFPPTRTMGMSVSRFNLPYVNVPLTNLAENAVPKLCSPTQKSLRITYKPYQKHSCLGCHPRYHYSAINRPAQSPRPPSRQVLPKAATTQRHPFCYTTHDQRPRLVLLGQGNRSHKCTSGSDLRCVSRISVYFCD